jgi:hypothetical protein
MTEQPEHTLVDFVALAAALTNEQKILATLERIEKLLTPQAVVMNMPPLAKETGQTRADQIAALAAKGQGSRRK